MRRASAWRIRQPLSTQGGTMAGKDAKIEHEPENSETDANRLEDSAFVERLVADGASRLTAERIVAIQQGGAEPGRARRHTQARR